MMSFKFLGVISLTVASVFLKAESKFFHPKFKGMILDENFDASSGQCKYFDTLYKDGEAMVPGESCQYICTCHVSEHYEGFLCEPLCPRYIDRECSPGWENKPRMVPAGPPEFGCFCEEVNCVPSLGIEAFRLR